MTEILTEIELLQAKCKGIQEANIILRKRNEKLEQDILKFKFENENLLKYHPSKFYPIEITSPYGVFFCKEETDYEKFKSEIRQNFILYAKEYFKDGYFAYEAEQKSEELDDILREMENTIYDD